MCQEEKMTQKELLYIEDCLGHLKTMEDLLNVSLKEVIDDELKTFISNEISITKKQYNSLYSLLGEQYGR